MSRIIVKNIPREISEVQLRDHFSKKGEITDVKIMKKENGESRKFAFIGFKSEDQSNEIVKYFNNTYINTCKIQVEAAKIQGDPSLNHRNMKAKKKEEISVNENDKASKIKKLLELAKITSNKSKFDLASQKLKENNDENVQMTDETEGQEKREPQSLENLNIENLDPKRLYVRNIAFEVQDDDLKNIFEKFGEITEIHIPRGRNSMSFGYAYIGFATVESAVMALSELDKTIFQGRIMHITIAKTKETKIKPIELDMNQSGKSDFKKQKQDKLRGDFANETNWNYLFMNQNAVIESISKKLNIPKSEIMSRDNANLAVQVAAMETTVINQTKDWLASQGINLDILKGKRSNTVRSKNTILIKNISPTINSTLR